MTQQQPDPVATTLQLEAVCKQVEEYKAQGKTVVLAHGAFDILHFGHVIYLERAKSQGDVLLVSLVSDEVLGRIKDPRRPIRPFGDRQKMIEAFRCVDGSFKTPDLGNHQGDNVMAAVRAIKPDVFVSSYPEFADNYADDFKQLGLRFVVSPVVDDISTSKIIKTITERYGSTG